jgi:hypothetical protein
VTRAEFIGVVLSKIPDEPRPVYAKAFRVIADLIYDPALAGDDHAQLERASEAFDRTATQYTQLAAALTRSAWEIRP